jgi:hypothetical protein
MVAFNSLVAAAIWFLEVVKQAKLGEQQLKFLGAR